MDNDILFDLEITVGNNYNETMSNKLNKKIGICNNKYPHILTPSFSNQKIDYNMTVNSIFSKGQTNLIKKKTTKQLFSLKGQLKKDKMISKEFSNNNKTNYQSINSHITNILNIKKKSKSIKDIRYQQTINKVSDVIKNRCQQDLRNSEKISIRNSTQETLLPQLMNEINSSSNNSKNSKKSG